MVDKRINFDLIESSYGCENCKFNNDGMHDTACHLCNPDYLPPSYYEPMKHTIQEKVFEERFSDVSFKEYTRFLGTKKVRANQPIIIGAKDFVPVDDNPEGASQFEETFHEYALVLTDDEFRAFQQNYCEYFDCIVHHIDEIDKELGESLSLSRLRLEKTSDMSSLFDCEFFPSRLSAGTTVFGFDFYPVEDYSCEQLVRTGKNYYWKDLGEKAVAALRINSKEPIYSEEDCLKYFKALLQEYLPDSFDYIEHIGPLRVYDAGEGTWNIKRPRAVSLMRYLCSHPKIYMD